MSEVGGASGGANNFKALNSRFMGRPQQKSADEKLREVSDMYEKHFLGEMLKAMRSTVHEGGFVQSNQAEKIFREQLDSQYVDRWGEKGGIGLSNLIYQQLVDKFGVAMGIKAPVSKPQGPLPLDSKSFSPQAFQHPGKLSALSYRIDRLDTQAVAEVKSPWDGILLGSKSLADNQSLIEIGHDNGLKSQVVFRGSLSKLSTGEKLQAGDSLGFLSSEAKSLYWTIETNSSLKNESGPQAVSE